MDSKQNGKHVELKYRRTHKGVPGGLAKKEGSGGQEWGLKISVGPEIMKVNNFGVRKIEIIFFTSPSISKTSHFR